MMKDRITELLGQVSYNRYALEYKRDDDTYVYPVITPMDGCETEGLKPDFDYFKESMYPLTERSFETDHPIEEIRDSIILGTHGITKYEYDSPYKFHRPVPSARGFHPCELYILSGEGVKRFNPVENAYDILAKSSKQSGGDEFEILVAADDWRLGKYYGNFAYVLSALDAGHIIGQISVLASKFGCFTQVSYDVSREYIDIPCIKYLKDQGLVIFAGIKVRKDKNFGSDIYNFPVSCSRRILYTEQRKKLSLRNEIVELREVCGESPNPKRILAPESGKGDLGEIPGKSIGHVLKERTSAHSHIGLMSMDESKGLSDKLGRTEKELAHYLKFSGLDKYTNIYMYLNAEDVEYVRGYYKYDNIIKRWVKACDADDGVAEWYRIIHDNHEFLNVESIPMVFFSSAKIDVIGEEYGNRLIDVMYMLSGEIVQIICLLMTGFEFFCRPIKNINEDKIEEKLRIDNATERITYAALAGKANIVQRVADTSIFDGRPLNE